MFLLIYVVIFVVQLMCPYYIQPVLMLINGFIPDPIPFVDEVIQVAILVSSTKKAIANKKENTNSNNNSNSSNNLTDTW